MKQLLRLIEEDNINTISQKIIERENERIVMQFNIQGYFTSNLRTIKNSNIEELYEKRRFFANI